MISKPRPEDLPPREERSEEELRQLLERPLPVSAVFAERTLSLPRVCDLEPGTVIPLGAVERVTLKAGDATVAEGIVVRIGNRLGIQLEKVRPAHELLAETDVQSALDPTPPDDAEKTDEA